jgi:hypothetical protein
LDKVAQLVKQGKPVPLATRETLAPLDLPAHLVLLVREVLPETLATLEIKVQLAALVPRGLKVRQETRAIREHSDRVDRQGEQGQLVRQEVEETLAIRAPWEQLAQQVREVVQATLAIPDQLVKQEVSAQQEPRGREATWETLEMRVCKEQPEQLEQRGRAAALETLETLELLEKLDKPDRPAREAAQETREQPARQEQPAQLVREVLWVFQE